MKIPEKIWAPVVTGLLMLALGVFGTLASQPWLFPSLGPTAFMQAEYADHRASQLNHVIFGHLIGLLAGFAAVYLLGARDAAPLSPSTELSSVRIQALILAITITILVQLLLHVSHPPAASTALLIAVGSFKPDFHTAIEIMLGVILLGILGEFFRRMRLRWVNVQGSSEDGATE